MSPLHKRWRNNPKCAIGIQGVDRDQILALHCLCIVNTACIFPFL